MKSKILILTVLVLLFMASAAMAEDNYENRQSELPDYNQEYYESFLDDPMVFAIRGEIPEMKLHNEKLDWIDQNNDYLRATLKSEEVKKYRENSSLNYIFSSNINGALLIEVEIQNKGKFDEEEFVNSVYPMYQKIANDQGIKNIPIYFAYYNLSDSVPEEEYSQAIEDSLENETIENEEKPSQATPGFTSIMLVLCILILVRIRR